MRILIAHNYYRSSSPSGEDSVFRNEVSLLEAAGEYIHKLERYNDSIDESSFTTKLGVAFSIAWSGKSYAAVSKLISEVKPDIAHFHNTFPILSPSCFAACRDQGVPVVQTIHNFRNLCPAGLLFRDGHICEECVGRLPVPALQHRCYRQSLAATVPVTWLVARNRLMNVNTRMVDRFIAPSDFVSRKLVAGGFPADRISVKPHFIPDPPDVGTGQGGYAIYVGRLSAEKGVRTLLAAWRNVDPRITLYIVGDGELRNELETGAINDKLNVVFTGMQPHSEVLRLIQDASFLVAPSECYETFGMSIIEAYACGTPVIASGIGGLAENVVNGETGWTVNPGDPEGLAARVNSLALDSAELARIRGNTRDYFDRRFTASRNLDTLMEIYNRAIIDAGR